MRSTVLAFWRWIMDHKYLLIGISAFCSIAIVAVTVICNIAIEPNSKYILQPHDQRHARVGLVLGAGVDKHGKPFRELQARLDVAAKGYANGQVDRLIVSGDNRFKNYNEPAAMAAYLRQTWHIPADKIQPDYAGRSTYESCERAAKIFGLKQTIIYSAGTHLPRAIYLCRHFGVEAYGVSSTVEANNANRREIMARVKAFYNIYIFGERTVLGPKIAF